MLKKGGKKLCDKKIEQEDVTKYYDEVGINKFEAEDRGRKGRSRTSLLFDLPYEILTQDP